LNTLTQYELNKLLVFYLNKIILDNPDLIEQDF